MGIKGHSEVNGLTGSARPRHPRQPGDERELDTLLSGDVRAMAEDDHGNRSWWNIWFTIGMFREMRLRLNVKRKRKGERRLQIPLSPLCRISSVLLN